MDKSEVLDKQIISSRNCRGFSIYDVRSDKKWNRKRAQFSNWEVAGKTGLHNRPAMPGCWFSKNYIAGVWIGYDNNTPLRGVTGGGLPADIWRTAMEEIHSNLTPTPLLSNKIYRGLGTDGVKAIDETSSFGQRLGRFFNRFFNSN